MLSFRLRPLPKDFRETEERRPFRWLAGRSEDGVAAADFLRRPGDFFLAAAAGAGDRPMMLMLERLLSFIRSRISSLIKR